MSIHTSRAPRPSQRVDGLPSVVPDLGVLEKRQLHYEYSRVPGWALRIAPRAYAQELHPDLPIARQT